MKGAVLETRAINILFQPIVGCAMRYQEAFGAAEQRFIDIFNRPDGQVASG